MATVVAASLGILAGREALLRGQIQELDGQLASLWAALPQEPRTLESLPPELFTLVAESVGDHKHSFLANLAAASKTCLVMAFGERFKVLEADPEKLRLKLIISKLVNEEQRREHAEELTCSEEVWVEEFGQLKAQLRDVRAELRARVAADANLAEADAQLREERRARIAAEARLSHVYGLVHGLACMVSRPAQAGHKQ